MASKTGARSPGDALITPSTSADDNAKVLYFKNLIIGGTLQIDQADIHPNTLGHTKIADLVEMRLIQEKILFE